MVILKGLTHRQIRKFITAKITGITATHHQIQLSEKITD